VRPLRPETAWPPATAIRPDRRAGLSRDRPKVERLRNAQRSADAGAPFTPPQRRKAGANLLRMRANYQANHRARCREKRFPSADGSPRTDRIRIVRASVLSRDFELLGFSPHLAAIP